MTDAATCGIAAYTRRLIGRLTITLRRLEDSLPGDLIGATALFGTFVGVHFLIWGLS